jgi:predicted phage terminase large subunit-like protein
MADYSVCTTWGIKDKRIYLLHVFRKRLNYPELKRAVRQQVEMHRATVVLWTYPDSVDGVGLR